MKNQFRRGFIKKAGMAAAVPLTGVANFSVEPEAMKNVFVHQVYFWLKKPGKAADRQTLIWGLHELAAVKTIKRLADQRAPLVGWWTAVMLFLGWLFSKIKKIRMPIRWTLFTKNSSKTTATSGAKWWCTIRWMLI